jgi:hypothetical protein
MTRTQPRRAASWLPVMIPPSGISLGLITTIPLAARLLPVRHGART